MYISPDDRDRSGKKNEVYSFSLQMNSYKHLPLKYALIIETDNNDR